MNNSTLSNTDVENIFEKFYYFIQVFECNSLNKSTNEEIKQSFEAACFVENSIKSLNVKSILPQFLSCLNAWLRAKNRTLLYNEEFYKKANDHLLLKNLAKKNQVNLSIQLYVSSCSQDRFQTVIEKAILRHITYEPILQYTVTNKNDINLTELKSKLFISQWKFEISCGKKDHVINSIKSLLNTYSVDVQLKYLIYILSMKDLPSEELNVQKILLEEILNKLDDRNLLSKHFWLTLIKTTDKKTLTQICLSFEKFLDKLMNFLIYCICMMDSEIHNAKRIWITNSRSICPEITFDDVTNLLAHLVNFNHSIAAYVEERIKQCQTISEPLIWSDVIKICY